MKYDETGNVPSDECEEPASDYWLRLAERMLADTDYSPDVDRADDGRPNPSIDSPVANCARSPPHPSTLRSYVV